MRKRIIAVFTVIFALVLGLAVFTACKSKKGGDGSVTISETAISIGVGDTYRLTAVAADGSKITWETSNASVVTVTSGFVSGKAAGTATITAKSESGGSATCEVTVSNITVEISASAVQVERFETVTLTATVKNGSEVMNEGVTWSSSDPSVATVDANGVVYAVKMGTASITATRTGGSANASCEVTVVWSSIPDDYYEVEYGGESAAVAHPDTWYWWGDQNYAGALVEATAECIEGALHFDFSGNTGWAWYNTQLFYKNSSLEVGTVYKLTFKLNSSAAGDITVNGNIVTLQEGDNDVTIYYIEEGGNSASVSIQMAIRLEGTAINPKTQIEAAVMVLSDMNWTVHTQVGLTTPSYTRNGDVVTITAPDEAGVAGYEIGFFTSADDAVPVASLKTAEKTYTLDTRSIDNGTYYLKVRAYAESAQYADSAWSAAGEAYVVANEGGVWYEIEAEDDADVVSGKYYYWSQFGGIQNAEYRDGTVSFSLGGGGNWDSDQLFMNNAQLVVGGRYTISLTFVAPEAAEGSVMIFNGSRITLHAGENHLSVSYTEDGGRSVSFLFGEPNETWNATVDHLPAGEYSFYNVTWTEDFIPGANYLDKVGATEAVANPGMWAVWYAEDINWTGYNDADGNWKVRAQVHMNSISYNEETGLSLDYTVDLYPENENCPWAVQLFYKNPGNLQGHIYQLSVTITSSVAGTITINGAKVQLEVGTKSYNIGEFVERKSEPSITIVMGDEQAIPEIEVNFADMVWTDTGRVDEGAIEPEYVKGSQSWTPNYATLEKNGESAAKNDTWTYWYVEDAAWDCGEVVTMNKAAIENDTIKLYYAGGSVDFSVQLFYKNTSLVRNNYYYLTLTIKVSGELQIKINGNIMKLTAGTHEIEVLARNEGTAFSLQLYGTANMEVEISNVTWYEAVLEGVETPSYVKGALKYEAVITSTAKGGEGDAQNDVWTYWYVEETGWGFGSVTNVTSATAEDDTLTLTYTGGDNWMSVQLFYKTTGVSAGKYVFTATIEATTRVEATINGEVVVLEVGVNNVEVVIDVNATALSMQLTGVGSATETLKISNVAWYEAVKA